MSEQPKEYIITEDDIKDIFAAIRDDNITQADIDKLRSRPHHAPAPTDEQCRICSAAVARAAREDVQPFIDLVRLIETKNREMADLMRRNGMKIDNLNDPMQKLAFTFYTEIWELAHKAGVLLVVHEAALLRGEPHE